MPSSTDRTRSALPGLVALAAIPIVWIALVLATPERTADSGTAPAIIAVAVISAGLITFFLPAVVLGAVGPATARGLRRTAGVVPTALILAFAIVFTAEMPWAALAFPVAATVASALNWRFALSS